MLKVLPGKRADNLGEATLMAIREAGKGELSPDVTTVFASVIDADKLRAEAERSINTAVHSRSGMDALPNGPADRGSFLCHSRDTMLDSFLE